MSLSMMLTTAAMWVNARPIRLALARDDYLETLGPGRRPAEPPARLRRSGRVVVSRQDGLPVYRYEPAARTPGLELMYLPGGGLVNPLVPEHWWIVERLARATGAAITVVCYPLAPERGADDTLTVIDAQYERLAARAGASRLLVGETRREGLWRWASHCALRVDPTDSCCSRRGSTSLSRTRRSLVGCRGTPHCASPAYGRARRHGRAIGGWTTRR